MPNVKQLYIPAADAQVKRVVRPLGRASSVERECNGVGRAVAGREVVSGGRDVILKAKSNLLDQL